MVMLDTLIAMSAEQQLVMSQSVQHGVMSANNPEDYALMSASNLLIDRAYPLGGGRCRLTTQDPDELVANDSAWGKHGGLWLLERE